MQCAHVGSLTTITTRDDASGVTLMLSNAAKLAAEFVRLRDLEGFIGSYDRDLQGEAVVSMIGPTYGITGTAMGFNRTKPTERTTETFAIRVTC